MTDESPRRVDELRRLLEAEIDRQVGPRWGCAGAAVGAGVLLGIVVVAGLLVRACS